VKRLALVFLFAAGLVPPEHEVRAQVYRCESESGVPVYQGTPSGRNCRALDLAPLMTIPAPKLPPAKGGSPGAHVPRRSEPRAAGQGSGNASPETFPRVDPATQRARDIDRRGILAHELSKEEARLAALRGEYTLAEAEQPANGQPAVQQQLERIARLQSEIGRAESNIAALKRELSAIRE
jgi:hypothetical protein